MAKKRRVSKKDARRIVNKSRVGTKSVRPPIKIKGKTRKTENV